MKTLIPHITSSPEPVAAKSCYAGRRFRDHPPEAKKPVALRHQLREEHAGTADFLTDGMSWVESPCKHEQVRAPGREERTVISPGPVQHLGNSVAASWKV